MNFTFKFCFQIKIIKWQSFCFHILTPIKFDQFQVYLSAQLFWFAGLSSIMIRSAVDFHIKRLIHFYCLSLLTLALLINFPKSHFIVISPTVCSAFCRRISFIVVLLPFYLHSEDAQGCIPVNVRSIVNADSVVTLKKSRIVKKKLLRFTQRSLS